MIHQWQEEDIETMSNQMKWSDQIGILSESIGGRDQPARNPKVEEEFEIVENCLKGCVEEVAEGHIVDIVEIVEIEKETEKNATVWNEFEAFLSSSQ